MLADLSYFLLISAFTHSYHKSPSIILIKVTLFCCGYMTQIIKIKESEKYEISGRSVTVAAEQYVTNILFVCLTKYFFFWLFVLYKQRRHIMQKSTTLSTNTISCTYVYFVRKITPVVNILRINHGPSFYLTVPLSHGNERICCRCDRMLKRTDTGRGIEE